MNAYVHSKRVLIDEAVSLLRSSVSVSELYSINVTNPSHDSSSANVVNDLSTIVDKSVRCIGAGGDSSIVNVPAIGYDVNGQIENIYVKFIEDLENIGDFRVLLEWATRVGSHVSDMVDLTLADYKKGRPVSSSYSRGRDNSQYPSWQVIMHWFRDFGYQNDALAPFLPYMAKITSYPDVILLGGMSMRMFNYLTSQKACDALFAYAVVHPNDPFIDGIFNYLSSYYADDDMISFFACNWILQVGSRVDECLELALGDVSDELIDVVLCKQLSGDYLDRIGLAFVEQGYRDDLFVWANKVGTHLDEILSVLFNDSFNARSVYIVYNLASWVVNVGYDVPRVKNYLVQNDLVMDFLPVACTVQHNHGGDEDSCMFTVELFYADMPVERQLGVII